MEQTIREKHFFSRERQLDKPASGAAAAKGRFQGTAKKKLWRMRTVDNTRSVLSRRYMWNESRYTQEARMRIQRKR